MKILKLVILMTFLFNSVVYPSDNLRVPMMGDKANKDRIESVGKLASGENINSKPWRTVKRDIFGQYDEIKNPGYSYTQGVWSAENGAWSSDNPLYLEEVVVPTTYEHVPAKDTYISSWIAFLRLNIDKMSEEDIEKCLKTLGVKDKIYIRNKEGIHALGGLGKEDIKTIRIVPLGLKRTIAKKLTKLQQKRPETAAIIREKALELLEIDEANFREALQPFIGDYIAIRGAIRTAGIADDTAEFYGLFDATVRRMDEGKATFEQAFRLAKESRFYGGTPFSYIGAIGSVELEEAVYDKFNTTQERREALVALKNLVDYIKSEIYITDYKRVGFLLMAIETANKIDELKVICDNILPSIINAIGYMKSYSHRRQDDAYEYINTKHISNALKYRYLYGDFKATYAYSTVYDTEDNPNYESGPLSYGDKGYGEPPSITVVHEKHEFKISPLTKLSNSKLTPALFLDIEVAANPDAFKQGLAQLKSNEGNIPVVLLTEETKDSIIAKLKGIDLTGVQFKTKAELGLQDLDWGKDERVSLIDGIDNLKCIPLTSALCETYKDLQKARDQV